MLLENRRGSERPFQTMRLSMPKHASQGAQRLAALFAVVGKRSQESLHLTGSPAALN